MCKCTKMKIQINLNCHGYVKGQVVTVDARDGFPISKFWRDRIKDSEHDSGVTVLKLSKKLKKSNLEMKHDDAI